MGELPVVTVFDLLSNERRVRALRYLSHHRRAELSAVAEHVAAVEAGISRDEVSRDDRKRVFISLYQTHVPRLEAAGVVTYDDDAGVVELTGEDRLLAPFTHERAERTELSAAAAVFAWLTVVVTVAAGVVPATVPVVGSLVGLAALATVAAVTHRLAAHTAGPASLADVLE